MDTGVEREGGSSVMRGLILSRILGECHFDFHTEPFISKELGEFFPNKHIRKKCSSEKNAVLIQSLIYM